MRYTRWPRWKWGYGEILFWLVLGPAILGIALNMIVIGWWLVWYAVWGVWHGAS